MNRTCTVVINHSIPKEFRKACKGVPYIGHEELTFCGRTLAAKWMLSHKKQLARSTDFYLKFWDDKNNPDYIMNFYWGGSKYSFDDVMEEIRQYATDPVHQKADADYINPYLKK
jgi:hypothetical protein